MGLCITGEILQVIMLTDQIDIFQITILLIHRKILFLSLLEVLFINLLIAKNILLKYESRDQKLMIFKDP